MGVTVDPMSWDSAVEVLHRIFPDVPAFTLSAVLTFVHEAKVSHELQLLPQWEDLSDLMIHDHLLNGYVPSLQSEVVLLNDRFHFLSGPVRVAANDLRDFIGGHLTQYGECCFNGDTLMAIPEDKVVLGLQHDGYLFRYRAEAPAVS